MTHTSRDTEFDWEEFDAEFDWEEFDAEFWERFEAQR